MGVRGLHFSSHSEGENNMRVLTRGDLDGLTSAVLLSLAEKVTEVRFAHPKDVQDGKIPCDKEDIVVNLPFVKGCGLWFDHHVSEERKLSDIGKFKGKFAVAPSAARVVYDYYKKPEFDKFADMLEATDRLDSAQLKPDDVTDPKGWILLGYTLDPRTGLGPEFQKYFRWLVEYVKEVSLEKVLQHAEVKKRVDRVLKEQEEFKKVLKKNSTLDGPVIITDFRNVKEAPVGNRFLIYTLHPKGNVEVRIFWGKEKKTVNCAIGHSIFNRTCKVNCGDLCASYGGGGHEGAGTCQLPVETSEAQIKEILGKLKK
jgi:nanoRNase/pAp phosphatase (c-di-AMP/oligoRNAs hydrolase)